MESNRTLFRFDGKSIEIDKNDMGIILQEPQKDDYLENFSEVDDIYSTEFGITRVSMYKNVNDGQQVVIKHIYKENLLSNLQRKQAQMEFPIQCALKHENIIQGYGYLETEDAYIGIMEYANEGALLAEQIDEDLQEIDNETKIKAYMIDILEGLDYIHSSGLIHCDIKLENILAHSIPGETIPLLKLCDFGLVQIADEEGKAYIEDPLGTHHYMAPEIQKGVYITNKVDLWSVGVVLYKMVCAYRPTSIGDYQYGSGPIPIREQDWSNRSKELKDLVLKLLEYDPEKRISAKEALDHAWFHFDD